MMSSLLPCALALLLAGGDADRRPVDPTLLVVLQTPENAGDPGRLTSLAWETGQEQWSTTIPLKDFPDRCSYVMAAGPDLWVVLGSRTRKDQLVAIDRATGRERFRIPGRYLGSPPAEGATALIFQQEDTGVVAINPDTGGELWRRRDLVPLPEYSSLIGRRLVLLVGKEYRALDPASGRDRWKTPGDNCCLEDDGDLLWVTRPVAVGIDPKTGVERQRFRVPEGSRSLGIAGGKAVVQELDRLEAYRLSSGGLLWSQPLQRGISVSSVSEYRGHLLVYLNTSERVLVFEPSSGRRLCSVDLPRSGGSCMGPRTRRVLGRWYDPGGPAGYKNLQLLDVTCGRSLWQGEADGDWCSSVRDDVYVKKGREVSRIDIDAGGARWTVSLPEQPWEELAGPGCTVVACGDRLFCLSASSGQVLWETGMPQKSARGSLGAWRLR